MATSIKHQAIYTAPFQCLGSLLLLNAVCIEWNFHSFLGGSNNSLTLLQYVSQAYCQATSLFDEGLVF